MINFSRYSIRKNNIINSNRALSYYKNNFQNVRQLIIKSKRQTTYDFLICSRNFSSSDDTSWNWIPPKNRDANNRTDDNIIPVFDNKLLSSDEIKTALESLGGQNIITMPLNPPLDTLNTMIIATGNSTRHLEKMSDALVKALKARNLRRAPGMFGPEGEKDDDWLYIDCYNIAVHLMLSDIRKILNLEDHWAPGNIRPCLSDVNSEKEYEKQFDLLLEKYPVPYEYNLDKQEEINVTNKIDPKKVNKL